MSENFSKEFKEFKEHIDKRLDEFEMLLLPPNIAAPLIELSKHHKTCSSKIILQDLERSHIKCSCGDDSMHWVLTCILGIPFRNIVEKMLEKINNSNKEKRTEKILLDNPIQDLEIT